MRKTILAWIIFFAGFGLLILIDYQMRIRDGNIKTEGMPPSLWFLTQIALAFVALVLAFYATKPLHKWWKRIPLVLVQGTLGFAIYLYMGLSYVCGMGIDCF